MEMQEMRMLPPIAALAILKPYHAIPPN